MIDFFTHRLHRFSIQFVISSFGTGTLTFLMYLAFPGEMLQIWGCILFATICFAHVVLLILLPIYALFHHKDFQEHSVAFLILWINLVLGFLYLNLAITL